MGSEYNRDLVNEQLFADASDYSDEECLVYPSANSDIPQIACQNSITYIKNELVDPSDLTPSEHGVADSDNILSFRSTKDYHPKKTAKGSQKFDIDIFAEEISDVPKVRRRNCQKPPQNYNEHLASLGDTFSISTAGYGLDCLETLPSFRTVKNNPDNSKKGGKQHKIDVKSEPPDPPFNHPQPSQNYEEQLSSLADPSDIITAGYEFDYSLTLQSFRPVEDKPPENNRTEVSQELEIDVFVKHEIPDPPQICPLHSQELSQNYDEQLPYSKNDVLSMGKPNNSAGIFRIKTASEINHFQDERKAVHEHQLNSPSQTYLEVGDIPTYPPHPENTSPQPSKVLTIYRFPGEDINNLVRRNIKLTSGKKIWITIPPGVLGVIVPDEEPTELMTADTIMRQQPENSSTSKDARKRKQSRITIPPEKTSAFMPNDGLLSKRQKPYTERCPEQLLGTDWEVKTSTSKSTIITSSTEGAQTTKVDSHNDRTGKMIGEDLKELETSGRTTTNVSPSVTPKFRTFYRLPGVPIDKRVKHRFKLASGRRVWIIIPPGQKSVVFQDDPPKREVAGQNVQPKPIQDKTSPTLLLKKESSSQQPTFDSLHPSRSSVHRPAMEKLHPNFTKPPEATTKSSNDEFITPPLKEKTSSNVSGGGNRTGSIEGNLKTEMSFPTTSNVLSSVTPKFRIFSRFPGDPINKRIKRRLRIGPGKRIWVVIPPGQESVVIQDVSPKKNTSEDSATAKRE